MQPIHTAHDFTALSAWQVIVSGMVWFALLYFVTALCGLLLTRHVLPRLKIGHRIDSRPLQPGQVRREIRAACISILVFGIGLLLPWLLLRLGLATLATQPSLLQIGLELLALFLWNELHFYATHRLLHTRRLRRFHADHHRSQVPTPFSTYSFHPLEAALLGSVPLLPMLVHDFSFAALVGLTVMSIVVNGIGHANYTLARQSPMQEAAGASRRHQLHHACNRGNYGFLLPWFDQLLRTALPADAAARMQPATRPDA